MAELKRVYAHPKDDSGLVIIRTHPKSPKCLVATREEAREILKELKQLYKIQKKYLKHATWKDLP